MSLRRIPPSGQNSRLAAFAAPALALALALAGVLALTADYARAEAPAWRFEAVLPPQQPGESGEEHAKRFPIGLGKIGDIEFWAPNRGLLITEGNPPTIPPGVWTYNGREWHELASVCGASDGLAQQGAAVNDLGGGRIAWAGPDEFWTVSDGRPGQAKQENREPPLEDDTLCHFKAQGAGPLEVVGSYASLAFLSTSYQAMHAAGCLSRSDCWFGGEVPEFSRGPEPALRAEEAFQLHWNGSSVSEEPYPAQHAIAAMRAFEGYLFESVRLGEKDKLREESESVSATPVLHLISPIGVQPTFISLTPGLPQYAPKEKPYELGPLTLSSDQEALWGAANPVFTTKELKEKELLEENQPPPEVTILRYTGREWSQVLGFGHDPEGGNPFTRPESARKEEDNETVNSVAAEPGAPDAWLALTSRKNAFESRSGTAAAMIARVSENGVVSGRQELPGEGEGVGLKGAADKIACPAANDCWLTTTKGWLFHYSDAATRQLPENGDPAFSAQIAFRPPDEGIPQVQPDAPPPDDSGLLGEPPPMISTPVETPAATSEVRVPVALLSNLHSRIVHGTTLELRFHLAVKARVRLLAKRHGRVVASTPMSTLAAGNRKLLLKLNRHKWPDKLELQHHALAPLPTTSTKASNVNNVSTGLTVLNKTAPFSQLGPLP